MSDYISKKALLEKLKYMGDYNIDMDYVTAEDIMSIPSADVRENIRGEWIAQDIHNCHTNFKCSKCGYIHNFMHLYGKPTADYTYCPNCGADMRGE